MWHMKRLASLVLLLYLLGLVNSAGTLVDSPLREREPLTAEQIEEIVLLVQITDI